MSAIFDPSLSTQKDEARLWLGDYHTNGTVGTVANAFLQDETIEAKIALHPFPEAVAQLASALIAKYANAPDRYEEGSSLKLEWKNRLEAWKSIVIEARKAGAPPTVAYRPGSEIATIASPIDNMIQRGSTPGFRSN